MSDIPRPWYRLRNMVLLLLLVILGIVGYQVWFAYTARPGSAINFNLRAQEILDEVNPQPKGVANGWPHLVAAGEAWEHADQAWKLSHPESEPAELDVIAWDEKGVVLAAAVDEYAALIGEEGGWAELDQFAASQWVRRPPSEGMLLEVLLPDLSWARSLARIAAALMTRDFADGNDSAALHRFDTLLAIGSGYTRQAWLIEHLVGYAIVDLACQRLREVMVHQDLSASTLASIDEILARRLPLGTPDVAFDGERLMMYDVIQRTHTDDGHGDGRFLLYEFQQFGVLGPAVVGQQGVIPALGRLVNVSHLAFPSKKQTMARADDFYDRFIQAARMTRAARLANPPITDAEIETSLNTHSDMILRILMPALGNFVEMHDQVIMRTRATRLMVAIERYRAAHGAPPDTLASLVPDFIAAIPADPYDNAEGFRYRRLNEGEAHFGCRGYLLYTIARDGTDDLGVPPTRITLDDDDTEREVVDQAGALKNGEGDWVVNLPWQQ